MLQGRFATKQSEARYPTLWNGLVAAFAPCITGPTGLRLLNFGRGGDGVLTNMDAPTDWVRSQGQYCLDFDGTDDLVVSTRSISFPFTMSGWVCSDSATAVQTICSFGSTSTTTPFAIIRLRGDLAGDPFEAVYYGTAENLAQSSTGYTVGRWHHVTGVFVNAGLVRLYVDGKLATTATTAGGTGTFNVFSIGALRRTTDIHFTDGKIDDIRIYNRALSASEIALLARRRGIAFEPIPRHRRLISRIVHPQPSAATESTGFVFDRRLKLFKGQYAVTKQAAAFPNLWEGCVGAWCPSIQGPCGKKVWDWAKGSTGVIEATTMTWDRDEGRFSLDNYNQGTGSATGLSRVLCGDGPQFNFQANSFALVGWAKYMSATAASRIFASQHSTSYNLRIGCDASGVCQGILNAGGSGTGTLTGTTNVVGTGWHHYALVSGSTGIFLYIDGRLEASGSVISGDLSLSGSGGEMTLGAYSNPTQNNTWPGRLDDIRIYNRVLQPSEIKTLSLSRGIAYRPRQKRIMPHYVTFPTETFTGPYIHVKRTKLLAGKFAVRKEDAKYPQLFEGRVGAWCPSITGPTGLKLFDFARSNTGTLTNMDASSDWVRSEGRYSLDFDGVNDYVALASVLNPSTNFSVAMWVNPSNLTSIMSFLGVTNTVAATSTGWGIRLRGDQVGDYFEYYHHGVGGGSVASSSAMVANTWQHIAAVKRGTSITVYLNGRSDGTGTISATTPETTNKPFIGARNASDTIQHFVTGQIDDVILFNRALQASEIRTLARHRSVSYTPKLSASRQYQPHNFAAVAATMSRLLMLRRKAALQCY